jgi:hypothetical protein
MILGRNWKNCVSGKRKESGGNNMLWLLQKLSDWMNRPYDPTSSIERLREKYKKPIDSDDNGGA